MWICRPACRNIEIEHERAKSIRTTSPSILCRQSADFVEPGSLEVDTGLVRPQSWYTGKGRSGPARTAVATVSVRRTRSEHSTVPACVRPRSARAVANGPVPKAFLERPRHELHARGHAALTIRVLRIPQVSNPAGESTCGRRKIAA